MSQASHIRSSAESLPWYRYGMVWLVIALPLTVVVASMFTIVLAYKNAPVIQTSNKPASEADSLSAVVRSTGQVGGTRHKLGSGYQPSMNMVSQALQTGLQKAPVHADVGEKELCYQCLEPISEYANIKADINGVKQAVCCHGCQAAAEFISGSELADFYRRRDLAAGVDSATQKILSNNSLRNNFARKKAAADWTFLDEQPIAAQYVLESAPGRRQLQVNVQGVYCASCGWLITHALQNISEGISCHLDSNANRLLIEVSDPAVRLSELLTTIEKIGYQPSPIALDGANAADYQLDERDKWQNRQALKRIAIAGFGMMQVMTYAVALYFGDFQGMDETFRRFLTLVSMLVATAVVFYSGKPFFSNAWNDLRNHHLGMDVPIALAIGGAYFPSVVQTLIRSPSQVQGDVYFDSAVMFVFFLSVGRYVEMRARHRLSAAPVALGRMLPATIKVTREVDSEIDKKPAALRIKPTEVRAGDRMHLTDQQVLAFDGLLLAGEALVDESLITGEATPIHRLKGDRVVAGSVLVKGEDVEVVASVPWAESTLAKIERLMNGAKVASARQAGSAQSIGRYFVAGVLITTVLVGIAWYFTAPERVFGIVLAMLVASCPCAFSLAAPIGAAAASHGLRLQGLLLANFDALKVLPSVTSWCFDKTGTITEGKPVISAVMPYGDQSVSNCLQLAAAIECQNNHVLSSAFTDIDSLVKATDLQRFSGSGVCAEINGERYYLGKPAWVMQQLTNEPAANTAAAQDLQERANSSVVGLGTDKHYLASFFIEDKLRPQAGGAINALQASARKTILLSGDRLSAVRNTAEDLHFDKVEADLVPAQKMEIVRKLQADGEIVAMLGDGINDAPVLAQADVSIVMSTGSEVSQSQADVIVLNGQLASLNTLHDIALKTRRITSQNLAWALLYNITVLPLAAAGLLTPWLAALGMSASSLLVVLNALRISRVRR